MARQRDNFEQMVLDNGSIFYVPIKEETDHKENNNKSYLVYILIIAGVAVIAVAVIIRNKGKKKS